MSEETFFNAVVFLHDTRDSLRDEYEHIEVTRSQPDNKMKIKRPEKYKKWEFKMNLSCGNKPKQHAPIVPHCSYVKVATGTLISG